MNGFIQGTVWVLFLYAIGTTVVLRQFKARIERLEGRLPEERD